jgi:uncharacterized protein YqgQ
MSVLVFSGEKFRAAKERMIEEEALTRLLIEKGIFTKEEFLEMVRVVNKEMNKEKL